MKLRIGLRLVDEPPDEAADQGTHDADHGGPDEPHLISPGRHRTRDETGDKPHDDRPDQVEHERPPYHPSILGHRAGELHVAWECPDSRHRATSRPQLS